jgi:hypothetical protein
VEAGCEFGCQAFGPPLQVSRKRVLHHSCDTAHYIDQSHADLSRRDDGFARMDAFAKRSIRNGLQTRAFDSVAVFTRAWCLGGVNETLMTGLRFVLGFWLSRPAWSLPVAAREASLLRRLQETEPDLDREPLIHDGRSPK